MPNIEDTPILVHSELETAGASINTQAQAIVDELDHLKTLLAPLAETWVGAASTYYEGLQQEWNIAAQGLFGPDGVLGQIARALNVVWGNYSDAESANIQTWKH